MAALKLREDQTTGQLILEPRLLPRLVGMMGNLVWVALFAIFFLMPSFIGGRFSPESVIIFLIVLLLSLGPSIGGIFVTSVKIEPANRMLSRTTRLLFLPIRSTALSFNDLANIEVQYYRQSSGRSSHDAYRVSGMDKTGERIPLNWDGKRDEMFALAQKISTITGAPLLDHTEKPASAFDQMVEMARDMGIPLPQESAAPPELPSTRNPPEPAAESILTQAPQAQRPIPIEEPMAEPVTALSEKISAPTRWDLKGLSVGELEQQVASDPTNSDARYMLARKYHARGQLDQAIELYQATLQTDTTNAEAQNDLGVALQQRGKRAEAEAAYRRAAALDPFSFNAHLNLALLLRAMKRATEASQEFFQARQSARGDEEMQMAEAASSGAKVEPRLSRA